MVKIGLLYFLANVKYINSSSDDLNFSNIISRELVMSRKLISCTYISIGDKYTTLEATLGNL